jgi:serine/threonine protein phosphatase PrpC
MAVADGHGSKNCPYSKTGSSIAVKVFCKTMSKYVKRFSDSSEQLLTYLNREGETKVAREIDIEWKSLIAKEHKKNNRDFPQIVSGDKCGEPDMPKVYEQYGTTLLGLVLANDFLFAYQLGDGDIIFTSTNHVEPVINGDKILGVETHSLSKNDAWKKAITVVRRMNLEEDVPSMFLMSSDGFSNSFKNENEFKKTCSEYFDMINQYGVKTVKENLKSWLTETSAMGCGDDITVLISYCSADQNLSIHDYDTSKEQIANDPPEMNSESVCDNEEDEITLIDLR